MINGRKPKMKNVVETMSLDLQGDGVMWHRLTHAELWIECGLQAAFDASQDQDGNHHISLRSDTAD